MGDGRRREQRLSSAGTWQPNANLRTQLYRFIHRAGVEPWPKLFQNLRVSREAELAGEYPIHVVCAWLGNTTTVANKHYLQVTEEHFRLGASGEKTLQNPVHEALRKAVP